MAHRRIGEDPRCTSHPMTCARPRPQGWSSPAASPGPPSAWFMLALGEQEDLIRSAIRQAGYPDRNARLAANAFDVGARVEWQRIASTVRPETWGMA